MGLSKTLHCSVSGRSISVQLRSGVYPSVSSFIYSFHFVCLLGKPGVCSSQSFAFFAVVIFGFSLPTSVLRRVIFVREMLSPGPGSLIGFTGKVNAQVLRPRYPHPRWYPSYPFGCPFAISFLGTLTTSQRERFFTTFPVGM